MESARMYDDALSKFEFDAAPHVVRDEVAAEPLALLWLHAPLDMAWKHTESAFEQFVANPESTELLFSAREQLQALQGLFVLLDDAVARLNVLEILHVFDLLEHKSIQANEACIEAVMLALLRLRVFVDLRRRDRPVTELALLDSFNRLRVLSGRDVVDARTYLEYVCLLAASPASVRTASLLDFQAKAKTLRLSLDKNLVAWLKRDPKAHLAVAAVFHQALHLSPTREESLLWWSAWHLAHVMQFANVMHANALKPLLGRINRFLKRRSEDKTQFLAAADLLDVLEMIHQLTRLLVEHAQTVSSVVQMLDDIHWPKESPSAERVAEAESLLLVADGEVFVQAADQVQASLAPVQDRFDLALRVNDAAAIVALAPDLEQLAAILGMLELSDASSLLAHASQRLRSAEMGNQALAAEDFEDIASALMRVDIELARLRMNLADSSTGTDSVAPALGDATRALIEQALADLLRAKEKLLNQDAQNNVHEVAGLLNGVGMSFAMLGLPVWYTVVDGLRTFIDHLPSYQGAFADVQDHVADVFASLEYGLENFRDFQRAPQSVLASGQRALGVLQSGTAWVAPQGYAEKDQFVVDSVATQLQQDSDVEAIEPDVDDFAEAQPVAQVVTELVVVPRLVPDDVDAEILEIFVEEGREIADALVGQLESINANHADREALADLRRSFHTIKGSGRIVGATLVGEFGWAFEHMLNQALEGVIEVSVPLLALLGDAQTQFNHLLDALEGKAGISLDAVNQAIQHAHALAEGQTIELVAHPAAALEHELAAPAEVTEVAEATDQQVFVPRIDPQLYEIFRNEVVEYLDYLDALVAQGEIEGGLYVEQELLRVTHSLLGGSRTAQAEHMMTLVQHVEHLVRAANEVRCAIQGTALSAIGQTLRVVRTLVDDLGGITVAVPDTSA
ncbi:MAG: hypothetical protein B7Y40_05370 [Gammaproteobacteria bacterium 28-57-27]|nr:MAG: hypothetical protein B7Y40_05370 [Gammaproteobacteria bacterium 28-57-27]